MFLILLAFERVYFNSILWLSRPRNVCQRRRTLRGRHGRNSPAAPGARPAQTSSLLHPMRTDVPEDNPRILGADISRNGSDGDLNGVEWWPVVSGALSQQHVPNWKSQSARRLKPWRGSLTFYHIHSTISASTGAKCLKFSANMRKRCAFRVRYVLFSLKCYSEDIDKEALLFGTPM